MKIRISPMALNDLEEIQAYIARDNEKAAKRFIAKLLSDTEKLGSTPNIGISLANKIGIPTNYLYIICKSYLVFYKVENDIINVYRFLHGARNYLSILELEK